MNTTHFFGNINRDKLERDLDSKEAEIYDALNMVFPNESSALEPRRENVKGNTSLSNSLPAGTNKCIGQIEDLEGQRLIWFNYNSNGDHGIYALKNGAITQILYSSVLNFQENYLITQVSVSGNFLTWTDNFNEPRYINIQRAIDGEYGTLNEKKISLMKTKPTNRPVAESDYDSVSTRVNRIVDKNFQFAVQYVYLDDEVSPLSPYSNWVSSRRYTSSVINSTQDNFIDVDIFIDSDVEPILKEVRLLVRESNTDTFKQVKRFTGSDISTTINYDFENTEPRLSVNAAIQTKGFDLAPRKAKALTLVKNRIFSTENKSSFDTDESDFTATFTVTTETYSSGKRYFKDGGIYQFGIVFYDQFMRNGGVYKISEKKFDWYDFDISGGNSTIDLSNRQKIVFTLSGKPPAWARYYKIVRTENLYQSQYAQVPCDVLFYDREDSDDTATGSGFIFNSREYLDTGGTIPGYPTAVVYPFHLVLPENMPITVDNETFVRWCMPSSGLNKIEPVVEVLDSFIAVTKNFGLVDWQTYLTTNSVPGFLFFFEFFKVRAASDNEPFYGCSPVYDINNAGLVNRAFNTTTASIYGDTFYFDEANYKPFQENAGISSTFQHSRYYEPCYIESPSDSYLKDYTIRLPESGLPGYAAAADSNFNQKANMPGIDFALGVDDLQETFFEINNEAERSFPNTVRYSEQFVQDSLINGFNSFLATNKETLPYERTQVTAFVPIDDDVVLVLHERNVTSMYIGDGFVKFGDENEFLARAEGVVGDERKSRSRYGCINPESIAVYTGKPRGEAGTGTKVYFVDMNEGAILRYAQNGLQPISDNGMQQYFRNLLKARLPYKDEPENKIYGGFHPNQKMYLVTFSDYVQRDYTSVRTHSFTSPATDSWTSNLVNGTKYRVTLFVTNKTDLERITDISYNSSTIYSQAATEALDDDRVTFFFTADADNADFDVTKSTTDVEITYIIESVEETNVTGETWAYNEERNGWVTRFDFKPEMYAKLGTELYGFKDGTIYSFDSNSTYCNFFGTQYDYELSFVCNSVNGLEKVWTSIIGNWTSETLSLTLTNELGQSTTLVASNFKDRDNLKFADIMRDENTISAVYSAYGANANAKTHGNRMKSEWLKVTITDTTATTLKKIYECHVGYRVAKNGKVG